MTRQDDELVRRYHEASEQEGARPGGPGRPEGIAARLSRRPRAKPRVGRP